MVGQGVTPLFPHSGDCREERTAARRLGSLVRNAVKAALVSYHAGAVSLRLDVRVSRRAGVGCCLILHRIAGTRNRHASGDWLPWSWPLTTFTTEDLAYLQGGQLPEVVRPCVIAWSKLLRALPSDPKVTL